MDTPTQQRNQIVAHRTAAEHYPYRCCVVCGLMGETGIDVAHLDQNAGNNAADNLAYLCKTHHWMLDAGFYPVEAIKLMRAHWQATKGVASHAARMKDAGRKAALTRKRSATASKAWVTRRSSTTSIS